MILPISGIMLGYDVAGRTTERSLHREQFLRSHPMQFFELLVIMLGVANGAIMPLLPDPTAEKRPIAAVLWLSLTMALATLFVPVISSSPRFASTVVLMFLSGIIAYFSVSALKTKTPKVITASKPAVKPVEQPTHA
jgi:hypothetical protein